MSPEVVESMYETMWEYLVIQLKSLEHNEVFIKNLGSFKARYKRIDKFIDKCDKAIKYYETNIPEEDKERLWPRASKYYADLWKLRLMKDKIEQSWEKEKEKRQLRHAFTTRNLEEQRADNGGDNQQTL